MIEQDARCVVNGSKVNEVIGVVNDLLNVLKSEEFDVVEYGNVPGRRFFLTGKLTGQKDQGGQTEKDKLKTGGGAGNQRDSLDRAAGGGGGALLDDGRGGMPPVPALKDNGVDAFGNAIGGRGGALKAPDGGPVLPSQQNAGMPRAGMPPAPTSSTSSTGGAFGGGTDEFGNELYADGSRVTPGGMPSFMVAGDAGQAARDFDDTPKVGAPPLSGDSGSGDFSPGSRDYRAMQLNNPEAFAAMEQAEKGAMMNDLPTLSSYLQQMGADLKKHNPAKYQALRQREAELNRELIWDDLQALNSYLDQRGEDLKKYNNTENQKLRARQAELSKQATQGRQ